MHNWCLKVWGDYACFTRPEMKVERVSYDVITPSAARAIFEAILWKPAISWHITKIEVLKPIKWLSVRRNEVGRVYNSPTARQMAGEKGDPLGFFIEDARQQKAGLLLRDVSYRLHGYFEFIPPGSRKPNQPIASGFYADTEERALNERSDESPAKYAAMFKRRAKKGQCFHRPYLGCREFACHFELVESSKDSEREQPVALNKDLGFMLYDLDFSEDPDNPRPLFFRANLQDGILNTDRREVEIRG